MYNYALVLHSILRWVVIVLGFLAVVRAIMGLAGRKPWMSTDGQAGTGFTVALDIQFLIGLLLYALLSPLTTAAFSDPGAVMGTSAVRFWLVEHPVLMIGAVVLAHIAQRRIRRQAESRLRHRTALIFFGLALLLLLAGFPWPFLPYGRPLLPFMG